MYTLLLLYKRFITEYVKNYWRDRGHQLFNQASLIVDMSTKYFHKLITKAQHVSAIALISALALLCFFYAEQTNQVFIYQYSLIQQGQIWRLITGHILHTNGYHLTLNLAVLWMLWGIHGHYYSFNKILVLFLISGITCSAGLFYFSPTITQYVGLSGVLHGLFVFGAVMDIYRKDTITGKAPHRLSGLLMLLAVTFKLIHEQWFGASQQVSQLIAANVAIDAHLWGAIGGLIFVILYWATCHKRAKARPYC